MSGAARTIDTLEHKSVNTLAGPEVRVAGALKDWYGKRRGIDTSHGFYQGLQEKQKADALRGVPEIPPPVDPTIASQADNLTRRRNRSLRGSSILTSPSGVEGDLGTVSRPQAGQATLLGGY